MYCPCLQHGEELRHSFLWPAKSAFSKILTLLSTHLYWLLVQLNYLLVILGRLFSLALCEIFVLLWLTFLRVCILYCLSVVTLPACLRDYYFSKILLNCCQALPLASACFLTMIVHILLLCVSWPLIPACLIMISIKTCRWMPIQVIIRYNLLHRNCTKAGLCLWN